MKSNLRKPRNRKLIIVLVLGFLISAVTVTVILIPNSYNKAIRSAKRDFRELYPDYKITDCRILRNSIPMKEIQIEYYDRALKTDNTVVWDYVYGTRGGWRNIDSTEAKGLYVWEEF